jgi:hypothetical protein
MVPLFSSARQDFPSWPIAIFGGIAKIGRNLPAQSFHDIEAAAY